MVFDIETDGLLDEVTKIYCMSYTKGDTIETTTSYSDMCEVLASCPAVVGHNITRYDLPVIEKLLGFEYSGLKVDTLALSWYLSPDRPRHGLEDYGVEFGYKKVKVEDEQWQEGNIELMIERCERDVKINKMLWDRQQKFLEKLYG